MNKKRMSRKWLLSAISAIMLAAVLLVVPVLASPATCTRDLPDTVEPSASFNVGIVASGCGIAGQVSETLPAGFTYVSCSDPGIGVVVTGSVVKFTFLSNGANFTYMVTAPAAEGTYTFAGSVKDGDLNQFTTGGDTQVEVAEEAPPPPADYPSFMNWLDWWGAI